MRRAILGLLSVAALCGLPASAYADNVLKIGVLGVMSGPAASWGLVNKYCAETSALMWNAKGGVEISGEKYKIEIVAIDDKNDPKLTVAGAQRLINEEGIKYIIGPNVDTTAASVRPVAEATGAMYFPTPSRRNSMRSLRAVGPQPDRQLPDRANSLQVPYG